MNDIDLLYQDDSLLVLNKPNGLCSVPGKMDRAFDSLQTRVQSVFDDALIVHRLDMSTSGILVMARGKDSQRVLNKDFADRRVNKEYSAIVDGLVKPTCGTIVLPLIKDWPNRPRQRIDFLNGKPSETHFTVLERDTAQNTTRLKLTPITGRSHQLRVHLQAYGHTIIGDELYATPEVRQKATRLMLHAQKIEIVHPVSRQRMTFTCEAAF